MLMLLLSVAAAMPIVPDARFALAIYCNPRCDSATVEALDQALASIVAADEFSAHVATPQRIMGMAGAEFDIPTVEGQDALARSEQVLLAVVVRLVAAVVRLVVAVHLAAAVAQPPQLLCRPLEH